MNESAKCFNCSNMNAVKISSGFKKPENKGKKYFTCANCQEFNWVENGIGVSTSGLSKVDYTNTPSKTGPVQVNNYSDQKAIESKKMMVMSAMKAAAEMTHAMLDTGMMPQGLEIDIDAEVIKRMQKYIGEMEKLTTK